MMQRIINRFLLCTRTYNASRQSVCGSVFVCESVFFLFSTDYANVFLYQMYVTVWECNPVCSCVFLCVCFCMSCVEVNAHIWFITLIAVFHHTEIDSSNVSLWHCNSNRAAWDRDCCRQSTYKLTPARTIWISKRGFLFSARVLCCTLGSP